MKKIVIAGLPNTGKSHVFFNLTGEYALVGNYHFTTVEEKRAQCVINGEAFEVIDTPGMHCLYIHSEEELVVRDMLLNERPEVIVQCIDANRLKQSLMLTSDLLELGIPMVISLNAIDETAKKGIWIDSFELSKFLGIPVIESVAVNGLGTDSLKKSILKASVGNIPLEYGTIVEESIRNIVSWLPENMLYKRKLAVLILLEDPFLLDYIRRKCGQDLVNSFKEEVAQVKKHFTGNFSRSFNNKRSAWISDLYDRVVKKQNVSLGGFSQAFARYSRHPVYGVPILCGILYGMYQLVVNVANSIAGWMHNVLWIPVENSINNLVPQGFWNEFLIGDYGVLTLGVSNALLTVVPILSVFFLAFNVLEDMGYTPNLCVLTKRIFEKIGLSGNATMPLILGFGCKTMATLTTKTLRSKKERYIAIYLIAFAIPCAAQMALNMSILGRIGISAFIIAFSVLAVVEIIAGIILNRMLKDEEKGDFIQELPPMRLPSPKAVLKKTYYRMVWFLKEALHIFVLAAVFLFTADKIGILDALKNLLRPIMEGFLGLPVSMVDALILCMAKHEAAAAMIMNMVDSGQLNAVQCIVSVTLTTMFVPCVANIVAMVKQLKFRRAIIMIITINLSAFMIAGILNRILLLLYK